ncbi:hemicentin-1-like [Stylophora pistillata]|uniref:hemicentin-1-like n=1 Tax=Stylophora pistillata TaxID=50429 RepID=UPI000C04265B|nr:hemicentin-1-like [Stylophora pistillata]
MITVHRSSQSPQLPHRSSGTYTCNVTNEVNSTVASTMIDVQEKPSAKLQPEAVTVKEGENVTLFCNSSGSSLPITWQFNGSDVTTLGDSRISFSVYNKSLIITNVSRKQKGEYKCVARNKYGDDTSNIAVVSVKFEPEVTIDGDQEQFRAKGENFTLICRYNSSPPVSEVQWIKDGKVIAINSTATNNGSRVTITHHHGSLSQLSIASASSNDSGTYTCNVTNELNSTTDSTSIVIQVTPSIETNPQASRIKEGENLTLFCNGSGSSLTTSWTKNGSNINSSEDSRILLLADNEQLTITNVSRTDNGAYQCVVSNDVGNATSNAAILTVQFGPEISQPPSNTTKVEGQTVVFSCVVAGYPKPDVAWTKDGDKLDIAVDFRSNFSSKDGEHSLSIANVQQSDTGQYRCVANNSLGTSTSTSATLSVQFAPEVTIDGDKIRYVANGTDLRMTCRFNALPPVSEVQWVKDGNVIASNLTAPSNRSRVDISHSNENQAQLLITAVSLGDSGNYTCNVTNNVGSSSNRTSIVIQVMPLIETNPQADPVNEGGNLTLFCNASGSSLTISWTKNGSGVIPSEDTRIRLSGDNEQLTITNVSRTDNGAYRCVASNNVGKATSDAAMVTVRFAPEVTIDGDQIQYVTNGTDLQLTCRFNALPPVSEVQWVKDGNVIASTLTASSNGSREIHNLDRTCKLKPSIETNAQADPVNEGGNLTLFCNASGRSLPISWTKKGCAINPSEHTRIRLSEDNEQLTITNVSRTDNGAYQCVASNNVGKATSDAATVTVRFKPEISQAPSNTLKVEGQTAVFSCLVAGYPTPNVTWTKNDVELNIAANSRLNVSYKGGSHSLTVKNVQQLDAGKYRCVGNNILGNSTSSPATLTVQFSPEVAIDGDQVQFVANGTHLQLTCRFNALPPASEVQWIKDETVIASTLTAPPNGSRVNISHHNESQAQLSIKAVSLKDSGNYTCNVSNVVGSSSNRTSIIVQVTPTIEKDPIAVPVKEGENFTLFCNASGSSLILSWTKNGSVIDPRDDSRIHLSTDNEQLTITNVSRKDNGAYQCVASNQIDNATSHAAIVTVQFAPEISQSPSNAVKVEGKTVVFSCVVAGYPEPDVAWTKNEVKLNASANARLDFSSIDGNHRLTISKIQQSDAGVYRCEATNSLDNTTSFPATLTVHFDPGVTIDGDKEQIVAKGDDIKITCRHKAIPPASELQWIKDGTVISTNSTIVINNSRLSIPHFNETLIELLINTSILADSGNYTCNVTNDVNSTSDSKSIIIEGV